VIELSRRPFGPGVAHRWLLLLGAVVLAAGLAGCGPSTSRAGTGAEPAAAETAPPAIPVTFADVTAEAGIDFVHNNSAFGKKYYPETMGSGCAFFDFDNDGWVDILLINGTDWADAPNRRPSLMRLYRNQGDGTFQDVTAKSGLGVEMVGMGVAIGDYDNDGHADVYVTAAEGPSRLFRNRGDGTFEDVTTTAGVDNGGEFATSAIWFDYDGDGYLDLFVCNYIAWSRATDIHCEVRPGEKEYCTPESYEGVASRLYRNLGNGRFEDVSVKSGIGLHAGKSMSAALCDYNNDGWLDLVVTNDTQPTFLFRNNGDGTFSEVAMETGIALGETGRAKAGMGIDAADVLNRGVVSVLTSNFSGESLSYYVGREDGNFIDTTALAGFGHSSLLFLGWGLFFIDYDLDGWKDAFVTNGHIYPDIKSYQPTVNYAERPLLYRNLGNGAFAEVGAEGGSGFAPIVGRGAAYADFDNDGDIDVLISANGAPARLLRNDGGNRHNWLSLALEGTRSNRDAIGAVVTVRAGNLVQNQMVRSGSSYASSSDRRLTFGLGRAEAADEIQVRWPSGASESISRIEANQRLRIREGAGLQR
jgi:enediyne biosynthesis protein E4